MKAKWYFLGCLTSVIILILFTILVVKGITKLATTPTITRVADNSVLHLNLSGQYQDYSTISDRNFRFIPETTHDIIQKINSAKTDSRIKAIVLEPQMTYINRSSRNEIIYALNEFKQSGKKVYGYITSAHQGDIYLLSVADEVYMNPSASAMFTLEGVGGHISYYKDMLDKMGITMRVVRAGEYKSAGEQFNRNTMSPEFRKNYSELLDDQYHQFVIDLANNYGMEPSILRHTFERGNRFAFTAQQGKELKIVDDALYYDDFLKKINITKDQLVKHTKYSVIPERSQFNQIAVVYAIGNITPSKPQFGENNINSDQYLKIFDQIEKNNSIKAVVIRINSGGGSALESEIIFNRIEQLKEKKPVVVSMGGAAASGGYYIATNANYIFADPYTVTGSIGVISMIPDLSGTADKIGINSVKIGHGKFISINDLWRAWNPDVERALTLTISEIYTEFKTRVSDSRNISMNDLEKIAQGMVWSARRAQEHNLIDEIGLLNDAIQKAAAIASVSNYSITYYPERKSFVELFMEENLDLGMIKMALTNNFPSFLNDTANDLQSLYEDIKIRPIQMRSEIIIKE